MELKPDTAPRTARLRMDNKLERDVLISGALHSGVIKNLGFIASLKPWRWEFPYDTKVSDTQLKRVDKGLEKILQPLKDQFSAEPSPHNLTPHTVLGTITIYLAEAQDDIKIEDYEHTENAQVIPFPNPKDTK
jgi:hypothetical protein